MDLIKTLAYAGLGLAEQTNEKMKKQFEEFVEMGKKSDTEGKNLVGDFFKTVDTTREEFEIQVSRGKNKMESKFPFLKDFQDRINELAKAEMEKDELTTKENETTEEELAVEK